MSIADNSNGILVIACGVGSILARLARCEVAIATTGVVECKHCFFLLEVFIDRAEPCRSLRCRSASPVDRFAVDRAKAL